MTFLVSAQSSLFPCKHCEFVLLLHKTVSKNELESFKRDRGFNVIKKFHELYIYTDSEGNVSVTTHHKIWKISLCQILVTQYKFCRILTKTW